jgi:hypothetical protein
VPPALPGGPHAHQNCTTCTQDGGIVICHFHGGPIAWQEGGMKKIFTAAVLAATSLCTPSIANDSEASIGVDGLVLKQNDAVSMDSEDLFISEERVSIKYHFTNRSDGDVEALITFPLPAIPNDINGHLGDHTYPDRKENLKFTTLVDGKPVELSYHEQLSRIGDSTGKDIGPRLKALGWPETAWDDYRFIDKLQELSSTQKAAYLKEGLLRKKDGSDYVLPNWQLHTHVTRKQLFPARKTVVVEHSYTPIAGSSVAGTLNKQYRKESYFKDHIANYCIDANFLKGFDKRNYRGKLESDGDDLGTFYSETWLSYVLRSGANWKGPIKDFRLVVDKGSTNNLVSFCMDGVKKISPTLFEVRKTNFEPKEDLEILIVKFFTP